MKLKWRFELPSLVVLGALWAMVAWAWPRVPAVMPVHFGAAGNADRYGGRAEGLLLLPVVAALFYVGSLVWPRIDPRGESFGRFARTFAIARAAVLVVFACLQAGMLAVTLGWSVGLDRFVMIGPALLMIVLGNYLPKMQPNWMIGVRTPWTLSSDLSWHRTHRLAGPMLMASGAGTIITALFSPAHTRFVLLGSLIATALIASAYSFVVWRGDGERRSN